MVPRYLFGVLDGKCELLKIHVVSKESPRDCSVMAGGLRGQGHMLLTDLQDNAAIDGFRESSPQNKELGGLCYPSSHTYLCSCYILSNKTLYFC